ncbi:DUF2971 domain-containing protein [Lachnospiraceae bacterium C1.1]|nr:DUF2971 domain-containing protein [Lachnospiraceae bacterium C1.1]
MDNYDDFFEKIQKEYGKIKLSDISKERIDNYKAIIEKLDLSKLVIDGSAIPFDKIDNPIKLIQFLTDKNKIIRIPDKFVSHYTSFNNLKNILSSKKWYVGNPQKMNDGLEYKANAMDFKNLFFASFSLETGENIAMWSMYGQPWENGVKISIPKKIFLKWKDQISKIYSVNSETNSIKPGIEIATNNFKSSICRVAYFDRDDDDNVKQLTCGHSTNLIFKDIDSKKLAGYIKESAWGYEKEIRLRIDISPNISCDKVAVDIPEEIIKNIIVTTGPRFSGEINKKIIPDVLDIRSSIYKGKLNYVYCDSCKYKNAQN